MFRRAALFLGAAILGLQCGGWLRSSGQTYLREIVLVADHASYHIGQIIALRRQLGIWK